MKMAEGYRQQGSLAQVQQDQIIPPQVSLKGRMQMTPSIQIMMIEEMHPSNNFPQKT